MEVRDGNAEDGIVGMRNDGVGGVFRVEVSMRSQWIDGRKGKVTNTELDGGDAVLDTSDDFICDPRRIELAM